MPSCVLTRIHLRWDGCRCKNLSFYLSQSVLLNSRGSTFVFISLFPHRGGWWRPSCSSASRSLRGHCEAKKLLRTRGRRFGFPGSVVPEFGSLYLTHRPEPVFHTSALKKALSFCFHGFVLPRSFSSPFLSEERAIPFKFCWNRWRFALNFNCRGQREMLLFDEDAPRQSTSVSVLLFSFLTWWGRREKLSRVIIKITMIHGKKSVDHDKHGKGIQRSLDQPSLPVRAYVFRVWERTSALQRVLTNRAAHQGFWSGTRLKHPEGDSPGSPGPLKAGGYKGASWMLVPIPVSGKLIHTINY